MTTLAATTASRNANNSSKWFAISRLPTNCRFLRPQYPSVLHDKLLLHCNPLLPRSCDESRLPEDLSTSVTGSPVIWPKRLARVDLPDAPRPMMTTRFIFFNVRYLSPRTMASGASSFFRKCIAHLQTYRLGLAVIALPSLKLLNIFFTFLLDYAGW